MTTGDIAEDISDERLLELVRARGLVAPGATPWTVGSFTEDWLRLLPSIWVPNPYPPQ